MVKGKKHKKTKGQFRKRLTLLAFLGLAMILSVGIAQYQQILRSKAASTDCTISDKLVNSCRPWLGAYANSYPGSANGGMKAQIEDHEKRIGKQVDVPHYYHPAGSIPLNEDEKYFINRADTYVLINWKPATKWADATGGNATINANIDKAAESIKSVAPKKVMLALHHEPENDISSGISCATLKGSSGSPKDFVDMWHNVRKRFDDKGVNNVVWAEIITGYKGWFCTLDALYPGDNYVDWILFDIYGGSNDDPFDESAKIIYDYLTQNSNSTHNYLSKPWGIGETSNFNTDKAQAAKYWDDAKAAVESNKYPNIKLYTVFDSKNSDGDFRIGYDRNGATDTNELEHYKAFAAAFSGTATQPTAGGPTGTATTVAPNVTTSPTNVTTAPTSDTSVTGGPTSTLMPVPTDMIVTPTLFCLGGCPTTVPSAAPSSYPLDPTLGSVSGGGGIVGGLISLIAKFITDLLALVGINISIGGSSTSISIPVGVTIPDPTTIADPTITAPVDITTTIDPAITP